MCWKATAVLATHPPHKSKSRQSKCSLRHCHSGLIGILGMSAVGVNHHTSKNARLFEGSFGSCRGIGPGPRQLRAMGKSLSNKMELGAGAAHSSPHLR